MSKEEKYMWAIVITLAVLLFIFALYIFRDKSGEVVITETPMPPTEEEIQKDIDSGSLSPTFDDSKGK